MNNMIKIDLIDDTSKINVNVIDNTSNIDVSLTDYNDKEVRDDIEELKQTKVDKIQGKGLSTNDFTDNEKNKLANLENYDDTEVRELIDTKQPRGNYLTQETDPTVPSHVKNITQNNISNWNNKQDYLVSGRNIKSINNKSLLGSGNMTSSDLGLQPAGNYVTNTYYASTSRAGLVKPSNAMGTTMTGDMISGYPRDYNQYISDSSNLIVAKGTLENAIVGKGLITKAVNDLENYYKKSETYTQTEINNLISAISTLDLQVVQTLPTHDISTTTIYLVPKETTEENDIYDEYIYISNDWEHIGSTQADLTDYIKNTDYASSGTAGIIRVGTATSTYMSADNRLSASTRTYEDYTSGSNAMFVGKGTLENVIEGKGLITNDDLTDYVKNNDYATNTKGGVIKWNTNYGTNVDSNGSLRGTTKSYAEYNSMHDLGLISKVTLENVIEGKGLVSNSDYADSATGGVLKVSSTTGTGISGAGVLYASNSSYSTYDSASDYYFIGKGTLENVIEGKGLATKNDIPKVFYGTSATGASTAAKVVVCEEFTEADLVVGTRITVLFTNANTYNGQATLNINGTGAKNIYYNGSTTNARYMWVAGESVDFIYNGTQWATINGGLATTSYYGVTKLMTSASSDTQSYALTPRSLYYFGNYSIAPYYSASETYAVGDKVRYSYYIYECITPIETPEAWTAAHWQQIDPIQKQIDDLEARIKALES